MTDFLSYYESRLLADAFFKSVPPLLTLNLPLAPPRIVFTLLEGKMISGFHPDILEFALRVNIEAQYLASFEDRLESFSLTSDFIRTLSQFMQKPTLFRNFHD